MFTNQEMLHLVYVVMSVAEEGKCIWRNAVLDKSEIDSLAKTTLSNHKFGELLTIIYDNSRRPWHITESQMQNIRKAQTAVFFPLNERNGTPFLIFNKKFKIQSLWFPNSIIEVEIKTFRISWTFFLEYLYLYESVDYKCLIITIIDIPSFWSSGVNLILPPDIFPTHLVVPLSVVLFPPLCNL